MRTHRTRLFAIRNHIATWATSHHLVATHATYCPSHPGPFPPFANLARSPGTSPTSLVPSPFANLARSLALRQLRETPAFAALRQARETPRR